MLRQWLVPVGVSLLAAVAGVLLYRYALHQPQYVSAPPAETISYQPPAQDLQLTDLRLPDLDGRLQALDQWPEPVLIVNFWAPWCAPCRREIPALVAAQDEYAQQLRVIGLSFDAEQKVREFVASQNINYPILLANEHSATLNRYFGNSHGGLPFTAVLNARREIVQQHAGEVKPEQISDWIEATLEAK